MPIYWVNGNKVADDYEDFYDGSWDDEANHKNQAGNSGPNPSQEANFPYTGCNNNGTENKGAGNSYALGEPDSQGVRVGRLNSNAATANPLFYGDLRVNPVNTRPLYGLSEIFQVAFVDSRLGDLAIQGRTDGQTVVLSPAFDEDTFTYTASVTNENDVITLTTTKNDSDATVVITNDDDTNTPNEAELNLSTGFNTLTVTITAADNITTKTYTINVRRAGADVPETWGLMPAGLTSGDQFRLIFISIQQAPVIRRRHLKLQHLDPRPRCKRPCRHPSLQLRIHGRRLHRKRRRPRQHLHHLHRHR